MNKRGKYYYKCLMQGNFFRRSADNKPCFSKEQKLPVTWILETKVEIYIPASFRNPMGAH